MFYILSETCRAADDVVDSDMEIDPEILNDELHGISDDDSTSNPRSNSRPTSRLSIGSQDVIIVVLYALCECTFMRIISIYNYFKLCSRQPAQQQHQHLPQQQKSNKK